MATLALYNPVNRHPFVNYDDDRYVVENPHIHNGLGLDTITWALHFHRASQLASRDLAFACARLQPVSPESRGTSLHQPADSRGERGAPVSAAGLATGRIGASLFVALLFAVHPINVESVAWIAERKNVLSTFFFLAGIGAYGWYARKPHWTRYLAVAGMFILGLMSKPMVITFPFVLLLLDYWPLGRSRGQACRHWCIPQFSRSRLFAEKIPLLALFRRQRRHHHAGAASRRGNAFRRAIFFRGTTGKRGRGVCHVFVEDDLAVSSGAALSSSGRFAGGMAGGAIIAVLLAMTGVVLTFPHEAVPAYWLALVSGNTGSRDRTRPGRRPGYGRPLCLHSADWHLRHDRVEPSDFAESHESLGHARVLFRQYAFCLRSRLRPAGSWTIGPATTTCGRTRCAVTDRNFIAQDNLGGALLLMGKPDEAYTHFQAAPEINPRDPMSRSNEGAYLQEHGHVEMKLSSSTSE